MLPVKAVFVAVMVLVSIRLMAPPLVVAVFAEKVLSATVI